METEFQLLNAKLSEKADNLELAEEQIWNLFAEYQGTEYTGSVEYPDSFNIRDTAREFDELKTAKLAATSPAALAVIDYKIMEALGEEPEEVMDAIQAFVVDPTNPETVGAVAARSEVEESLCWIMRSPDGKLEEVESAMTRDAYLAQGWVVVRTQGEE